MDDLDSTTVKFTASCYLVVAALLIVSFGIIVLSSEHKTTPSLVSIYAFEIISVASTAAALISGQNYPNWYNQLRTCGLVSHWVSISIFTG